MPTVIPKFTLRVGNNRDKRLENPVSVACANLVGLVVVY